MQRDILEVPIRHVETRGIIDQGRDTKPLPSNPTQCAVSSRSPSLFDYDLQGLGGHTYEAAPLNARAPGFVQTRGLVASGRLSQPFSYRL